jgi:hypothetical protein
VSEKRCSRVRRHASIASLKARPGRASAEGRPHQPGVLPLRPRRVLLLPGLVFSKPSGSAFPNRYEPVPPSWQHPRSE